MRFKFSMHIQNFQGTHIYKAHHAVIFAIAHLSCSTENFIGRCGPGFRCVTVPNFVEISHTVFEITFLASRHSRPPQLITFENFWNARWRRPPSWEIKKSSYLKYHLTDFVQILHSGASCPPPSGPHLLIQIVNCKNSRWQLSPFWEIEKLQ